MFEPRRLSGNVRSSMVLVAVMLGLTSGLNDVEAEGIQSILTALAERSSLRAQSNDSSSDPEAAPSQTKSGEAIESDVPFSELNEALTEARSRLAELTKAAEIAKVADELREELEATKAINQQLEAALNQTTAENGELKTSNQTISRQADEAQRAAADASVEVRRLDEELVAMRWQNSQLSTSLTRAEATASEATKNLDASNSELTANIESLALDLDAKIAEVVNLNKELDATREGAKIADQRGAKLEEELTKSEAKANAAEAQSTKLVQDLDVTIAELTGARSELSKTSESLEEMSIALAAAEQEKAVLREQFTVNREETDVLRQKLGAAETQIKQVSASNNDLQQQVEVLRAAAGEATDAARLNLIAVNNQINEINAALANAKGNELLAPSGGPANAQNVANAKTADVTPQESEETTSPSDVWVPEVTPARAVAVGSEDVQQFAAAASPTLPTPQQAKNPSAASNPLANRVVKIVTDENESSGIAPADATSLLAGLSSEQQQSAEALFENLNVRTEERGLTITLPGTVLFAVNSDTIEPDANEILAKVAEVARHYNDRQILVIGHTDAVGDGGYNQQLSERRADLVKNYFVDEFDIAVDRLSAEGQGETSPITSNATAQGRDTNRRVEVIVLNN